MIDLMALRRKCWAFPGLRKKDAADNSGENQAALTSAQTGQDALKWYEDQYAATQPDRDATQAQQNALATSQINAMNFATQQAQEQAQRNETIFQPLEDKLVGDAQNYDTPDRRAQAVAQAASDVNSAYDKAAGDQQRALMRQGNSPTGVAAAALNQSAELQKAKAISGATQQATQQVEQQGYAREMDAAGLGKGVVSNQATQQQIATGAGNAGLAASSSALNTAYSGMPMMQAGYGSALQGASTAGSLYGQAAQIQNNYNASSNSSLMSGLEAAGEAAAMYFSATSSKRLKMRRVPMSDEEALAANNRLQVEKWDYKPGAGDGGTHLGPYAEDVQREFGDGAAPGGKVINMNEMAANNGKSIAALTKQLAEVNGQIDELTKRSAKRKPKSPPRPRMGG